MEGGSEVSVLYVRQRGKGVARELKELFRGAVGNVFRFHAKEAEITI